MSSAAFHLKIISPAAVVVDAHVPSVNIPGVEGDFGVLPNHSKLFSMLRPGVIDVALADGTHRRFFAATGYADVTHESCTVISDHIQDLADISPSDAEDAVVAARLALTQAEGYVEKSAAEKILQSALALENAVKK